MIWFWLRIRQAFNVNNDDTSLSEPDVVLGLLQTLRACDTVTPLPGFYDRVRTRIEQIEQQSIWIPVIYSRVTVRLAIACFCFSLALFGYVFGTEGTQIARNTPRVRKNLIGSSARQTYSSNVTPY